MVVADLACFNSVQDLYFQPRPTGNAREASPRNNREIRISKLKYFNVQCLLTGFLPQEVQNLTMGA
jgi:hypothetical protein